MVPKSFVSVLQGGMDENDLQWECRMSETTLMGSLDPAHSLEIHEKATVNLGLVYSKLHIAGGD